MMYPVVIFPIFLISWYVLNESYLYNLQVFFIFTLYNTSNHNDQLKVWHLVCEKVSSIFFFIILKFS